MKPEIKADLNALRPPEPKILPKGYMQGVDSMSSEDFLKIYMETLRYQDPFQPQDLSKMLEDMTKLNQIRHMKEVKDFLEGVKGWLNQITLISSLNFIGREMVFSTDKVDTLRGGRYYLLSSERIEGATIRVKDGEQVVKEIKMDINRGLNPIPLQDLPRGQFTIEVVKGGIPVQSITLGVLDRIRSVSLTGHQLLFELDSGEFVSPSRLVYIGEV